MEFGVKRLAITGGLAEGKSTVLGYLRDAGIEVVSADDLAREVWQEPSVQGQIADALGVEGLVEPERARRAMADIPGFRRRLNRITHPSILRALLGHPADVVEAPLLIEACLHPLFRRIWVVTCGREEQLRRLAARLGDARLAESLLASQLPTAAKCAFADRIVRTNRDEPSVRAYVLDALAQDIG